MASTYPKRTCGSCSLCCKLMTVPEVKENHSWCPHARPGAGGCAIYRTRPQRCREFHCMWLLDAAFPDYWQPLKAKIVVDAKLDGSGRGGVAFVVDPAYPLRWKEEPYFSDIKHIARAGIEGRDGKKWVTVVMIEDETIPIIAGRESELAKRKTMFNRQAAFAQHETE